MSCFIPARSDSWQPPPKARRKGHRRDPNALPLKRNRGPKPKTPQPDVPLIHDPKAPNQKYGYSDEEDVEQVEKVEGKPM